MIPFFVVLSVVFAFLISLAAYGLPFTSEFEKRGSAAKASRRRRDGAAIPVMHYTGMAAASFTPAACQWTCLMP